VEPALAKDLNDQDVECFLKVYDNLRLKANMPTEVIEHIDKNLIQVSRPFRPVWSDWTKFAIWKIFYINAKL
jgi:hypothetical protein